LPVLLQTDDHLLESSSEEEGEDKRQAAGSISAAEDDDDMDSNAPDSPDPETYPASSPLPGHGSPGPAETIAEFGVSDSFVYRQWSNLCRWGFDKKSLRPRRDSSGGAGVKRPCDLGPDNKPIRKKAGKKTEKQEIALAYGITLDPEQPGMNSEWAAAIRAADNQIPTPKPSWTKRCELITKSAFCAKSKNSANPFRISSSTLNTMFSVK